MPLKEIIWVVSQRQGYGTEKKSADPLHDLSASWIILS